MRSFLIILGTTAALVCAFALYVRMASPPGRSDSTPAPIAPAAVGVGNGQTVISGAWSNLYDKDGQLYGRLRSKECVPAADGLWHLTLPEADFYQRDGQIAHLAARDGDVRLGEQTHKEALGNGPVDPPSQGTLNDVTVKLFSDQTMEQSDEPEMTLHMDNTRFDADTYRLYTVSAGGLAADQIPISVRGRQMDFDGRGILLEWNGQAHELKSLTVEHEQSMRLRQTSAQPASPSTRAARGGVATRKTVSPVHVYLATFDGGVRVTQNGQERIAAPVMTVTLASGSATKQPEGSSGTPPSGEKPKTQESPMDVVWGGVMHVVPGQNPGGALAAGQSIIHFGGGQVLVSQDTMKIAGSDVTYDNAAQAGVASGTAEQPLRISFLNKQGKDSGTVATDHAQFWQQTNRVALGPGVGRFSDPSKAGDVMNANWAKACNLTLIGTGSDLALEHAQLIGDAIVRSGPAGGADKMKLTAQQIDTDFVRQAAPVAAPGRATTRPGKTAATETVPRRLIASTGANCVIHDTKAKGSDAAIAADKLTVDIAEDVTGKAYPHFVTAEGNVQTRRDDVELSSRRLDATVLPAPGKSKTDDGSYPIQIQTLVADGDVHLRGKDGETGTGEILTYEEHDNQEWVRLVGGPVATVTNKQRTLSGHELQLRPKENWAEVTGAGTMDGVATAAAGKPEQPIHAKWDKSATILGNENHIDIIGGVEADTTDATGVIFTVRAEQANLTLAPKPATRPSKTAVKSDSQNSLAFDPLKDKQVKLVTLLEHASMERTLLAADKSISRRAFIKGERIDADIPAQHMSVPGPGQMLLEEHRKRDNSEKTPVSGQGTTAFQWTKQFTYDDAGRQAVFEGSVYINHMPDGPKASATSLAADKVIADFEPEKKPTTAPSTGKKSSAGENEPPLKQLRAEGHVLIHTGTKLIEAAKVVYDPATDILTIDAPQGGSVVITDTITRGQETCDQATVNVRTNEFNAVNVRGNARK